MTECSDRNPQKVTTDWLMPYSANLFAEPTSGAASRANVDASRCGPPRRRKADALPSSQVALGLRHGPNEPTPVYSCLRSHPRSLRVNSLWALGGNIVYAGCQWSMLVALAKLGSPEMVGQFALALAITAPIMMLSMLQLRAVQATDAKGEYEFGHYLALRLITSFVALLVVGGVAFISGYRKDIALLIVATGLFKTMESVSDAYHGLMQKHERIDLIAVGQIIKGLLFLTALAVAVRLSGSLLLGVMAMAVSSLAVLIGFDRERSLCLIEASNRRTARPVWEWRRLAALLRLALPLGIVMLLVSLNTNIPNYVIERYLGERELGYFAALAYLQVAHSLLVNAVGHAVTPRFSQYYSSNNRKAFFQLLIRVSSLGLFVGILIVAIASLFGQELLAAIYKPEYAAHARVLLCLMVAAAFSTMTGCFNCAVLGARCFRLTLGISAIMLLTTLVTAGLMVPVIGLMGAAVATLCGSIARFVCSTVLVFMLVRQMPRTATPRGTRA